MSDQVAILAQLFAQIKDPKLDPFLERLENFLLSRSLWRFRSYKLDTRSVVLIFWITASNLKSFKQARFFATDTTQVSLFKDEEIKAKLEDISDDSRPVSVQYTIADFKHNLKLCAN